MLEPAPRRALGMTAALALLLAPPAAAAPPRVEKAVFELVGPEVEASPGVPSTLEGRMEIEAGWHVNSHEPTYDYLIPTRLELALPAGWPEPQVEYPEPEIERFTFAEEPLSVFQGSVVIRARIAVPPSAPAAVVPVVASLTYQACDDTTCLPPVTTEDEILLRVTAGGGIGDSPFPLPTAEAEGAAGAPGLLWILLLGLLGGLILNAMPCVLPVLSIKLFGLVKSAALSRREVVRSGLATAAGILFSFWLLAAAAVAARAAGSAVGWGVQFQEPAFVAFLAVVVVLFSLNLWGVFEIGLPGRLANLASRGPSEGLAGHFVSGLFATLMATPCSAPFLGTAMGFALAQPASTIVLTFTAVGTGMALPYLTLAAWPGAARLLPRPGPWMVYLKEVMGFLLAGAAVWLFYVLAAQISSERLAFVQLAILALALAVWLRPRLASGTARGIAGAAVVAAAVGAIWIAADAPVRAERAFAADRRGGHVDWVPFDRAEAERLAEAGRLVFVDVTADWCFTCKVNERLVLDTPVVGEAFDRHGVVAMRADWTNRDERIGDFLADFGRYGIPFYLLYRPAAEPYLFGELLTREAVLEALEASRLPGDEVAAR